MYACIYVYLCVNKQTNEQYIYIYMYTYPGVPLDLKIRSRPYIKVYSCCLVEHVRRNTSNIQAQYMQHKVHIVDMYHSTTICMNIKVDMFCKCIT